MENLVSPSFHNKISLSLVAGAGIAPASQGYGPRMVLLHYPAYHPFFWIPLDYILHAKINQDYVKLNSKLIVLYEVKITKSNLIDSKRSLRLFQG